MLYFPTFFKQFATATKRSFSRQNKECNEKLMSEEEKTKVYYATDLINNGADFDQEISLWMKYWVSKQKNK